MNTDLTGSAPMLRRVSQDRRAGAGWSRHRGLVTAIAVFALLLATVAALGNGGLSYFDLSFWPAAAPRWRSPPWARRW